MEEKRAVELTKSEEKLISLIRDLRYGEVRVLIKAGQPIRAEEIKKSVQLVND